MDSGSVTGIVVRGVGPIIDVAFESLMPPLGRSLRVEKLNLQLEVIEYIDGNTVRCLALNSTDTVHHGMKVIDSQQPVSIPLGKGVLGRVLNAFGDPLDNQAMYEVEERRVIQGAPPDFGDVKSELELYVTRR